jgi:hypothetical protein
VTNTVEIENRNLLASTHTVCLFFKRPAEVSLQVIINYVLYWYSLKLYSCICICCLNHLLTICDNQAPPGTDVTPVVTPIASSHSITTSRNYKVMMQKTVSMRKQNAYWTTSVSKTWKVFRISQWRNCEEIFSMAQSGTRVFMTLIMAIELQ